MFPETFIANVFSGFSVPHEAMLLQVLGRTAVADTASLHQNKSEDTLPVIIQHRIKNVALESRNACQKFVDSRIPENKISRILEEVDELKVFEGKRICDFSLLEEPLYILQAQEQSCWILTICSLERSCHSCIVTLEQRLSCIP